MKKQTALLLSTLVLMSAVSMQPAHAFKFGHKKSKPAVTVPAKVEVAPVAAPVVKVAPAAKVAPVAVKPVVKPVVKAVAAPVAKVAPAVKPAVKPVVKPVAKK